MDLGSKMDQVHCCHFTSEYLGFIPTLRPSENEFCSGCTRTTEDMTVYKKYMGKTKGTARDALHNTNFTTDQRIEVHLIFINLYFQNEHLLVKGKERKFQSLLSNSIPTTESKDFNISDLFRGKSHLPFYSCCSKAFPKAPLTGTMKPWMQGCNLHVYPLYATPNSFFLSKMLFLFRHCYSESLGQKIGCEIFFQVCQVETHPGLWCENCSMLAGPSPPHSKVSPCAQLSTYGS